MGVQEILADMIAKDKETLTYVQSLWDTIFSPTLQSLLIIIFLLYMNLSVCLAVLSLCISPYIFLPVIPNYVCMFDSAYTYVLRCDRSAVTIHSSVSKTALKEQQPQEGNHKSKPMDIAKFSLYTDFTCDVQRIQHHQV